MASALVTSQQDRNHGPPFPLASLPCQMGSSSSSAAWNMCSSRTAGTGSTSSAGSSSLSHHLNHLLSLCYDKIKQLELLALQESHLVGRDVVEETLNPILYAQDQLLKRISPGGSGAGFPPSPRPPSNSSNVAVTSRPSGSDHPKNNNAITTAPQQESTPSTSSKGFMSWFGLGKGGKSAKGKDQKKKDKLSALSSTSKEFVNKEHLALDGQKQESGPPVDKSNWYGSLDRDFARKKKRPALDRRRRHTKTVGSLAALDYVHVDEQDEDECDIVNNNSNNQRQQQFELRPDQQYEVGLPTIQVPRHRPPVGFMLRSPSPPPGHLASSNKQNQGSLLATTTTSGTPSFVTAAATTSSDFVMPLPLFATPKWIGSSSSHARQALVFNTSLSPILPVTMSADQRSKLVRSGGRGTTTLKSARSTNSLESGASTTMEASNDKGGHSHGQGRSHRHQHQHHHRRVVSSIDESSLNSQFMGMEASMSSLSVDANVSKLSDRSSVFFSAASSSSSSSLHAESGMTTGYVTATDSSSSLRLQIPMSPLRKKERTIGGSELGTLKPVGELSLSTSPSASHFRPLPLAMQSPNLQEAMRSPNSSKSSPNSENSELRANITNESSKPFEMADFYKYSSKFRQQRPSGGSTDNNNQGGIMDNSGVAQMMMTMSMHSNDNMVGSGGATSKNGTVGAVVVSLPPPSSPPLPPSFNVNNSGRSHPDMKTVGPKLPPKMVRVTQIQGQLGQPVLLTTVNTGLNDMTKKRKGADTKVDPSQSQSWIMEKPTFV